MLAQATNWATDFLTCSSETTFLQGVQTGSGTLYPNDDSH